MRGTIIRRILQGAGKLLRDQRGNAFMLTAAAVVPLIGIIGSGVDIGRAYMAELRLQQACDAGVLAGRRAMTGGTYSASAEAEADKMFAYNYPDGTFGSDNVSFSSEADGPSDVVGTANARLPTALMKMFGFGEFNLAVNCTAKLEISNVDVMLVLDVTGSMAETNKGDKVDRITALQDASIDFFDTLTTAEIGDGRLRFGVVPYSSTANVGKILYDKDPSWLSDYTLLPSRSPVMDYRWDTSKGGPPASATDGTFAQTPWADLLPISNFDSSSSCTGKTPPADTAPTPAAAPTPNLTAYYVDKDGTRRYVTSDTRDYIYYNYRYSWTGGKCWLQRRTVTFTTKSTPAKPKSSSFDDLYRYQDRLFDVTEAKTGAALVTDVGDGGDSAPLQTNYWGGCVIERQTVDFDDDDAAPDDAYDMDVDMVPTSDEATKWRLLIPEITFARNYHPSYAPSKDAMVEVKSKDVTKNSSSKGNWQNYSKYWADGWGVCPAAAMKLTTMTDDDRGDFKDYIESLKPVGGTYHDAGMVWGVRLLSPDGLFKDENAEAPNKRPISRHIIFMTDGAMAPNFGNLTFQGYEPLMKRVGATSDSALKDRHNNRFLQLCEAAKKKNITVWVVSFGLSLNDQLTECASSGRAFEAKNADDLNENFQAIARQISKLRLSQ